MAFGPLLGWAAIVVRLLVLTDQDGTCARHDVLDVRIFLPTSAPPSVLEYSRGPANHSTWKINMGQDHRDEQLE